MTLVEVLEDVWVGGPKGGTHSTGSTKLQVCELADDAWVESMRDEPGGFPPLQGLGRLGRL